MPRNAEDQERDRIQPTALAGFARDDAQAEVQTRTAKSNPDLARGRRARVRPNASSPRSIPEPVMEMR